MNTGFEDVLAAMAVLSWASLFLAVWAEVRAFK